MEINSVSTAVTLCGVKLDNPIIGASGCFGYGAEINKYYDINILGTFSFKGTTLESRFGNQLPRVAETPSGMLNSVGLQNPGVDAVINKELKELDEFFHKGVMSNIGGSTLEDYVACAEKLDKCDKVVLHEINISCPNVSHGGMSFGASPEGAAEVVKAVKSVTKKPVIMKLTPNVTDIVSIAVACEKAGADGVSLINTLLGMRIDLKTRKPILNNVFGGLSGPAVFPVALRMVYQVAHAVSIPVIGLGGISTADNVIEMMMAGATAVQVGAANLVNPYVCKEIIEELPVRMAKLGIKDFSELKVR